MDPITLTADDIKAFRTATRLTFHLTATGASMRAVLETRGAERKGPFSRASEDLARDIAINHATTEVAVFSVYGYGGKSGSIAALRLLVKVGDTLYVQARTNNNQYLDNAGLFHDELLVSICRPSADKGRGKTIVREMVLAWSTCPNNTARAIRS